MDAEWSHENWKSVPKIKLDLLINFTPSIIVHHSHIQVAYNAIVGTGISQVILFHLLKQKVFMITDQKIWIHDLKR